ncbi:MAG: hypothetical protein V1704_01280 [Candidatus Vogelbacteria bacterium]
MKKHLTTSSFIIIILIIAGSLFSSYLFSNPPKVLGDTAKSLSGFAWSSNIGWIQMNGGWTNPVTLNGTSIVGYAWSSNVGWISFNPDTGTPPSGTAGVSLDLTSGDVTGWARACSVFASECRGNLKDNSERGGWDGWISMSGPAGSGSYGVKKDGDKLTSFAWGDTNLGWITFCADASTGACVKINSLNVTCETDPLGSVNIGTPVNWKSVSQVDPTYQYDWSWDAGTPPVPSSGIGLIQVSRTEDAIGNPIRNPIRGTLTVTDPATGKTGNGFCEIQVKDLTNPILTVSLTSTAPASGSVSSDLDGNPNGSEPRIDDCTTSGPTICSNIYGVGDVVTLTANPGNTCDTTPTNLTGACSFTWGGYAASCGNQSTCPVTMIEDTPPVLLNFFDPNATQISLDANPKLLVINNHNGGQTALSNESTITNNSVDTPATVCVQSFISLIPPFKSIDAVVSDGVEGNTQKVKCVFNNGSESMTDCSDTNACTTIAPNGGIATFSVMIPTLVRNGPRFNQNSPYEIKLGAGQNNPISLRFKYNAGDIVP